MSPTGDATTPADLVKHSEREGGPTVAHEQGTRAYDNTRLTRVVLPAPSQFPPPIRYAHTALHEWTGPLAALLTGEDVGHG